MKKSTKTLIIVGVVLLVLVGVIGVTYSFFSVGGIQDTANTFTSGCLNISLENESTSISLNNAYPVTDIEGLEGTSYDFTIRNNCSTSTNYQINLESLNETASSLGADYIKVALSSDTADNVISILGDNTSVKPEIEGAYESYNLYTGTIGSGETKTYHLKMWLDYDATADVAASKTYTSKINVTANPDTSVVDTLEAKFSSQYETVTSTLTNNVTSASYCVTEGNSCEPNTSATISNNSYSIELEAKENKQMVCTRLNGTSKVICSEPEVIRKQTAADVILAGKTISDERSNGITGILIGEEERDSSILYTAKDDWGTSYFFAGLPNNNWVSFAGHYWRIIRINGDGSIRMIYSGEDTGSVTEANRTGEGTQIGTSAFNEQYNDNAYVGYMYGTPGSDTYEETHANTNNSTIKTVLDNWYQTNLTSYSSYISTEAGFCNDRQTQTVVSGSYTYGTTGYGTNRTGYAPWGRLYADGAWKTSQTPTLECTQENNDLFTVSGSSKGNHELTYPIGLITSDEVVLAGGFGGATNQSYYLYTNQYYWTMSTRNLNSAYIDIFCLYNNGTFSGWDFGDALGIRPVINLRADVTLTGDGTSSNPYTVEGAV